MKSYNFYIVLDIMTSFNGLNNLNYLKFSSIVNNMDWEKYNNHYFYNLNINPFINSEYHYKYLFQRCYDLFDHLNYYKNYKDIQKSIVNDKNELWNHYKYSGYQQLRANPFKNKNIFNIFNYLMKKKENIHLKIPNQDNLPLDNKNYPNKFFYWKKNFNNITSNKDLHPRVLVILPISHKKEKINNLKSIVKMFIDQQYDYWDLLFLINDLDPKFIEEINNLECLLSKKKQVIIKSLQQSKDDTNIIEINSYNNNFNYLQNNKLYYNFSYILNEGVKYFLNHSKYSFVTFISSSHIYYPNFIQELVKDNKYFKYTKHFIRQIKKINNLNYEDKIVNEGKYKDLSDLIKKFKYCNSFMWHRIAIEKIGWFNSDLLDCHFYEYLARTFIQHYNGVHNINYSNQPTMETIIESTIEENIQFNNIKSQLNQIYSFYLFNKNLINLFYFKDQNNPQLSSPNYIYFLKNFNNINILVFDQDKIIGKMNRQNFIIPKNFLSCFFNCIKDNYQNIFYLFNLTQINNINNINTIKILNRLTNLVILDTTYIKMSDFSQSINLELIFNRVDIILNNYNHLSEFWLSSKQYLLQKNIHLLNIYPIYNFIPNLNKIINLAFNQKNVKIQQIKDISKCCKFSIVMAYYNRKSQLFNTLKQFNTYYSSYNLEVIIIDDNSDVNHKIERDDLINFDLNFKVIINNSENKGNRINPCLVYNQGFNLATGEIIIIQNPECYHVGNLLEYIYHNLTDQEYLVFSCFSPNNDFLSNQLINNLDKLSLIKNEEFLVQNSRIKPYVNWYNNPQIQDRDLKYHFCSAIFRKKLELLGGFDRRFQYGFCFDDDSLVLDIEHILKLNIRNIPPKKLLVIHQYHQKDLLNKAKKNKEKFDLNKRLYQSIKLSHQVNNYPFPKFLFLYWDGSPLSYLNYLTVISFNHFHKNWRIVIFTPENRTKNISWKTNEQKIKYLNEDYFPKLRQINNVSIQKINLDQIGFFDNASEVIKSDYFRYYILYQHGGIWSDFDIIYTGSIEEKMNFNHQTVIFNTPIFKNPLQKKKEESYMVFPIGLFAAQPKSEFFFFILSKCQEYYDPNEYQCIGAKMFMNLFPNLDVINSIDDVKICSENYYLPWAYNELEQFLDNKNINNSLPTNNIGIHWFNGADRSKKYAINLENRINNFYPINFLDKMILPHLFYTFIIDYQSGYSKDILLETLKSFEIYYGNKYNFQVIIVNYSSLVDIIIDNYTFKIICLNSLQQYEVNQLPIFDQIFKLLEFSSFVFLQTQNIIHKINVIDIFIKHCNSININMKKEDLPQIFIFSLSLLVQINSDNKNYKDRNKVNWINLNNQNLEDYSNLKLFTKEYFLKKIENYFDNQNIQLNNYQIISGEKKYQNIHLFNPNNENIMLKNNLSNLNKFFLRLKEDTNLYSQMSLKYKKISIVMAYFNRKDQLIQTLKSIKKSKYKNIEIIIVDDNSDQEYKVINFIYIPDINNGLDYQNNIDLGIDNLDIKIINIQESEKKWVNPCIAYNIGFNLASGEIIVIQNPEVMHVGDCLDFIAKNLQNKDWITFNCYGSPNFKFNNYVADLSFSETYSYVNSKIFQIGGNSTGSDKNNGWINHYQQYFVAYHYLAAIHKQDLLEFMDNGFSNDFKDGIGADDDDFIKRLIYHKFNFKINKVHKTNCLAIHLYHYKSFDLEKSQDLIKKNRDIFNQKCCEMNITPENDINLVTYVETPKSRQIIID